MLPRTPLAKIATAALAGSLALGGGVALAALDDTPDPSAVAKLDATDATESVRSVEGTLDDDPVDEAADGVREAKDALHDAKEAAKEARHEAGDDEGDDPGEEHGNTAEHPVNHGQVVSTAAHETPPGPGHGQAVSAVARGTHGPSGDDDEEHGDEAEHEAETGSSHGEGHGEGHGGRDH